VTDGHPPDLSVVIVTPADYQVIRKTIRHLAAQTVRERLEIVIGATSEANLAPMMSELQAFHSHKIVELGEVRVLSEAKAAVVPRTTAPIVVFAEDHCFPEPGWAEGLLSAHARGFPVVGPVMGNANPATSLSWAGLFLHYGCCLQARAGPCTNLPWHNTSYRRHLLLEYGPQLGMMLLAEGILLDDLRAKGHQLHLETAARTNHVNITRPGPWIRHAFLGGRLFAALRAERRHWSLWRRMAYVAASPLVPIVRLKRTLTTVRQVGRTALLPRVLPPIVAGLLPHALGEVVGYALGLGRTPERYSWMEANRRLHVTPPERHLLVE
jgi:hypothetical protein